MGNGELRSEAGKSGNIPASPRVFLVMKVLQCQASRLVAVVLPMILAMAGEGRANSYDPLVADATVRPSHLDLTVHDAARNRDIRCAFICPPTPRRRP